VGGEREGRGDTARGSEQGGGREEKRAEKGGVGTNRDMSGAVEKPFFSKGILMLRMLPRGHFAECENQTAVKESSRKSKVPGTFLFWQHDLFEKGRHVPVTCF
jgi:hypothetical protein